MPRVSAAFVGADRQSKNGGYRSDRCDPEPDEGRCTTLAGIPTASANKIELAVSSVIMSMIQTSR